MKTLSTLTFAQIQEVAAKQQAYEASYSLAGLRLAIKESVAKLNAETLDSNWTEYLAALEASEVDHKEYHHELLSQHKVHWAKVFTILIEDLVISHSYLEHRIAGYKLGQQLCNKVITSIDSDTKRR